MLELRSVLTPPRSEMPVEMWALKGMVQTSQAALRTKSWEIQVKLVIQLSMSTSRALHLSVHSCPGGLNWLSSVKRRRDIELLTTFNLVQYLMRSYL